MQKGIYALANNYGWGNQQLTKNCGLVPYLFQQLYGYRAVMVGTRAEWDYPGQQYIPGVELVPLPDGSPETMCDYIAQHAAAMDIVVLHGPFPFSEKPVALYRQLRPDGKIYLELDPNIHSLDKLEWDEPAYRQMLASCNVIGSSGHSMQRYLSAKWPCIIDYLPNGFYDLTGTYRPMTETDFQRKEPLILTVGRIGTAQKNNACLVAGFLQVYRQFPEWRLLMVGPVEPAFRAEMEELWAQEPALRERILMPGPIQDKEQLWSLYRRARIFALTSVMEGGTPNVVAEALMHGCYTVMSDYDAADDATADGRCGAKFPLADAQALPMLLQKLLAQPETLAAGGRQAYAYAQRNFDFVKIVQRLHYLLGRRN